MKKKNIFIYGQKEETKYSYSLKMKKKNIFIFVQNEETNYSY